MTFILALGNQDQIIQISDRKIFSNGKVIEDEQNKEGFFVCSNARLAFGISGLARCGTFNTKRWLLENLLKLGPPEYDAQTILDRLTEKATNDFKSIPDLARVSAEEKRLSILFTGYLYNHDPPLAAMALVTNFQDFDKLCDDSQAWDSFRRVYWNEARPLAEFSPLIQRIGVWPAMYNEDEVTLRYFLQKRKPAKAIVGKAVELVRLMADRPEAGGMIGKQLASLILPRDINRPPSSFYHTLTPKPVTYVPSMVATTKDLQIAVDDPKIAFTEDSTGKPFPLIHRVSGNARCPCGSGKKYKFCHGKQLQIGPIGVEISNDGIKLD